MQRVAKPLIVKLTERPGDLQTLQRPGKMALWRRPGTPMFSGMADESERARPVEDTFQIAGVVSDVEGLLNPRGFQLTVGNGAGHPVVLYPSPTGTRFGKGGGLVGRVRFDASGNPASWALLTLEVTASQSTTLHFHAQADAKGDFMLATSRLPPLPESVESYSATLSIKASLSATAAEAVDPGSLVDMELGDLEDAGDFENPIELNVVPGDVRRLRSANKDFLAVQPE